MIAECQRANAAPRRQRNATPHWHGSASDFADRLTVAVRDGPPGYRYLGWFSDLPALSGQ
jgi:hypothetical protein